MIYRLRWLLLAVAGTTAAVPVILLGLGDNRRSLASRVVEDCRDRLRTEVHLGSSAEWRPGPGRLIRNMNGTYSVIAEARMADSRGRIVGIFAHCDYAAMPDSSFEHYSTRIEETVVEKPDVPIEERSNLP